MKQVGLVLLAIAIMIGLSSCTVFRAENPLNVKCPSCGYLWDNPVDHTPQQQLPGPID